MSTEEKDEEKYSQIEESNNNNDNKDNNDNNDNNDNKNEEEENDLQENQENQENKENQENNIESQQNYEEEPIEVEVEDRGMNTDELPPEELQRLVDNNIELKEENDVINFAHESKEKKVSKKALIDELNEKDKIFELLVKTNNQLKNKIELSNKKYQEILAKIEMKKSQDIESKLTVNLPVSGDELQLQLLSEGRIQALDKMIERKIKKGVIQDPANYEFIVKVAEQVVSINGEDFPNEKEKHNYILNLMAKDYNTLVVTINKVEETFGLDQTIYRTCANPQCQEEMEVLGAVCPEFFRPTE